MLQMKEKGKNPQDQINEGEIGNLPEKEFRVCEDYSRVFGLSKAKFAEVNSSLQTLEH